MAGSAGLLPWVRGMAERDDRGFMTAGAWQPDETELEAIIDELPTLLSVRAFAGRTDQISWFSQVGETPVREETEIAEAYLAALGFPDAAIAGVPDWDAAMDCAQSGDTNSSAWEAEEQLRAGLHAELLAEISPEALDVALTYVRARCAAGLERHMDDLAATWDLDDAGFLNAAAGAAVQAAHDMALALAADAEAAHPFRLKFRLFECGRWPIGVVGASFHVF